MKLYFRKSKGRLQVMVEPSTEKECDAAIKQKLKEYGLNDSVRVCYRKTSDSGNYKIM